MCDLPSWIQTNAAGIQAVAAVTLVVITAWTLIVLRQYAADTKKMAEAAVAQAETVHMPCLTLHARQRDYNAALLDENARTDVVLRPHAGQVAIENYGTGPAMNIEYVFKAQDRENIADLDGYIPYLAPKEMFVTKMPQNLMHGHDYLITLRYASLSGQKYRTELTSRDLALVNYNFTKQE
jgi:hypothetical protein